MTAPVNLGRSRAPRGGRRSSIILLAALFAFSLVAPGAAQEPESEMQGTEDVLQADETAPDEMPIDEMPSGRNRPRPPDPRCYPTATLHPW